MPSLFRSKDKREKEKEESADTHRPTSENAQNGGSNEALPAYSAQDTAASGPDDVAPSADVDLAAAFAKLSLPSTAADPDPDTCLAHLKLLFAIQSLKEDIGYTDGLWNIWDTRAEGTEVSLAEVQPEPPSEKERGNAVLSKIREKRWALFVARAVERYEAWWNSLPKDELRVTDMQAGADAKYDLFVHRDAQGFWTTENMLPLGESFPRRTSHGTQMR